MSWAMDVRGEDLPLLPMVRRMSCHHDRWLVDSSLRQRPEISFVQEEKVMQAYQVDKLMVLIV